MTKPIRIQRRRTRGFDLQRESRERNGLACVSVTRPGKFGNPFKPEKLGIENALEFYEQRLKKILTRDPNFLDELKGKNLACWCRTDARCHGDILLRYLYE